MSCTSNAATNPRRMIKSQWKLVELVCFTQPDSSGVYFNEMAYRYLYALAPNIQMAFEALEKSLGEAKAALKRRLEEAITPEA